MPVELVVQRNDLVLESAVFRAELVDFSKVKSLELRVVLRLLHSREQFCVLTL